MYSVTNNINSSCDISDLLNKSLEINNFNPPSSVGSVPYSNRETLSRDMARIVSEISVMKARSLFFLTNKILPIFCLVESFLQYFVLFDTIILCYIIDNYWTYIARKYQAVPSSRATRKCPDKVWRKQGRRPIDAKDRSVSQREAHWRDDMIMSENESSLQGQVHRLLIYQPC